MPINVFKTNQRANETSEGQIFAEDLIRVLQPPCGAEEESRIERMIEVEAAQVEEDCRREIHTELEAARRNQMLAAAYHQEHLAALEREKDEVEKAKTIRASFILLVTTVVFFLACMIAEWEITWATLPYILGVKQHSFEGVMLSLAPITGLAILKVVFAFLIWDPWQKVREASASPRKTPKIVMALFLIAVGAFTVFTIARLAEARSEIVKLKELTRGEDRILAGASEQQQAAAEADRKQKIAAVMDKINWAVYVISICLAINGALFFLIFLTEWNRLRVLLISLLVLFRRSRKHAKSRAELAEAEIDLARKTKDCENIDTTARTRAEHYRARLLLLLEQALKRPPRPRPYRELAAERLAASV
jgi:hypothetical protein